jgi:transposase
LAKTDPIDARLIADFIAFRPDFGRRLPTEELCHLNALSTKRRQLMELRKRLKCQIKQHANGLMVTLDTELLELLSRQIKGLEDALHAQIINDPQMKQHATILRSISGIGPVLCATLIAEMPELGMFGDKKDAALSGVAPMNRENGRMDGRRSIKGGRQKLLAIAMSREVVIRKLLTHLRILTGLVCVDDCFCCNVFVQDRQQCGDLEVLNHDRLSAASRAVYQRQQLVLAVAATRRRAFLILVTNEYFINFNCATTRAEINARVMGEIYLCIGCSLLHLKHNMKETCLFSCQEFRHAE